MRSCGSVRTALRSTLGVLLAAVVAAALPGTAAASPGPPELGARAQLLVAAGDPLPESTLDELTEHDAVTEVLPLAAARFRSEHGELAVLAAEPGRLLGFGGAPDTGEPARTARRALQDGHFLPATTAEDAEPASGGSRDLAEAAQVLGLAVAAPVRSAVPGIQGFVSAEQGSRLGMPQGNAALVRTGDPVALQEWLTGVLPEAGGVQLLPGGAELAGPARAPVWDGDRLSEATVERAIAAAESRLGRPYVWGGSGPEVFDCSGLVQWAFARAGVSLPRVTHEQWRTGPQLDYEQARRGDLLFWRSDPTRPDYISHVAIYLGQGRMIEAPFSGAVVRTTQVRLAGFAGAVRISP